MLSARLFLWCKYPHWGQVQATSAMSLSVELRKDAPYVNSHHKGTMVSNPRTRIQAK